MIAGSGRVGCVVDCMERVNEMGPRLVITLCCAVRASLDVQEDLEDEVGCTAVLSTALYAACISGRLQWTT